MPATAPELAKAAKPDKPTLRVNVAAHVYSWLCCRLLAPTLPPTELEFVIFPAENAVVHFYPVDPPAPDRRGWHDEGCRARRSRTKAMPADKEPCCLECGVPVPSGTTYCSGNRRDF